MIDFYYSPGPNPIKVALPLEELGVDYNPIGVDVLKGDHHKPEYVRINPNEKVPALVDDGVPVFDSNAILLYLADKYRQFAGDGALASRGRLLSWLLFVASGVGPFSGQSVHFTKFAPQPQAYALQRYRFEANRHYEVLERHLADKDWLLGDDYSIADMALWGWIRHLEGIVTPGQVDALPNLLRLRDAISRRPAAERAQKLVQEHDMKVEMDEEALKNLFAHRRQA